MSPGYTLGETRSIENEPYQLERFHKLRNLGSGWTRRLVPYNRDDGRRVSIFQSAALGAVLRHILGRSHSR